MTNEPEAPERIWAKVRTFSRFYGVKTETEVRREWCENYATPEIARKCGAVEYTRANLSDAKDKRIAELEAKLAAFEIVQCWTAGEPPKYLRGEWFIAKTKHGDRVVLRALSEKNSYDYTTADETYMKAENVIAWMQFPDSNYISYVEGGDTAKDAIARIAELEGKLATCVRNAEKYANDCLELEKKMSKALEILEKLTDRAEFATRYQDDRFNFGWMITKARATLAALKGQTNDQ